MKNAAKETAEKAGHAVQEGAHKVGHAASEAVHRGEHAASDAVQAQLTLDQALGRSTWFTRYVDAQSTTLDSTDVDFGRPQPVSAARQRARAFFSDRPALASSYRTLRRAVRRTLGLGP